MPRYDDGLDDDGYPLSRPYVQGSEEIIGDFKPVSLGGTLAVIVERARAAMEASKTADSPIETILGAAIVLCFQNGSRPLQLASDPSPEANGLQLIPQFRWAAYRSDWAIYNPKTSGALLIECDGKDFHSSANQISHDMRKDQAAHDRGYLTMRFTGSQIHRGADACAKEIFDFVYGGDRGSHS
jgi:very-short-patch-repair endonuclease